MRGTIEMLIQYEMGQSAAISITSTPHAGIIEWSAHAPYNNVSHVVHDPEDYLDRLLVVFGGKEA